MTLVRFTIPDKISAKENIIPTIKEVILFNIVSLYLILTNIKTIIPIIDTLFITLKNEQ